MKVFLKKVVLFGGFLILVSVVYYNISKAVLDKYGLSTDRQISLQFQNFDNYKDSITVLFLGNSRLYRGINPYKISGFTYNMAHDNDSYNQIYYKVEKAVSECPNLKKIIIGYDYFQFSIFSDSRNYIYNSYFPKEYRMDYSFSIIPDCIQPYMQFVRNNRSYINELVKTLRSKQTFCKISDRGQFTIEGQARSDDFATRTIEILPVQDKYFNMIVDLLGNTQYEVYFITLPIRDNEYKCYTKEEINFMKNKINDVCNKYQNFNYIDDSRLDGFLEFNQYTDLTHFNSAAADDYSIHVNHVLFKEIEENL